MKNICKRCGHHKDRHVHHRRGKDCGGCTCARYRHFLFFGKRI